MVIDSFAPIHPELYKPSPEIATTRDKHPGYTDALKAGDTIDVLKGCCGDAARDFPSSLWLEKKDRPDKARQNDKDKTWGLNYVDRYTNQHPTHECTTHALRVLAEAARNRQRSVKYREGPKKNFRYDESGMLGSVWLAPLSIYAEANPGQWGGAGCRQVLEIACRRGFLPEKIQPRDYKFKHSLHGTTGQGGLNQSRGPWVRLSQFPEGFEETSQLFRPLEVIFTDDWEQVICLILHGYCVEVGRDGHAIPYAFWNEAEQAMGYIDSYDVLRFDPLSTVKRASRGAFAIVSMPTPNNWLDPAGTLSSPAVAL